jgi:hypothetical protein
MRILWIGQQPYHESAGEEVVERNLKRELAKLGHEIEEFHPRKVSRAHEVANLALRGLPYYRARYESSDNLRFARQIPARFDMVVGAWEPFDRIALESTRPTVLLLHNITSSALRSVLPNSLVAKALAHRSDRWERAMYRNQRLRGVVTLSIADCEHVQSIAAHTPVVFAPPGMPPQAELLDGARFRPELWLSGTYGWFPKRRDVLAFANEFAQLSDKLPVLAKDLPAEADGLIRPRAVEPDDRSSVIRLGIIADRFLSGHKLKTTYYLSNNAVVLSYADIGRDFEGIVDSEFFVRRIRHVSEVARHVAELSAVAPSELVARLREFKRACAERFSWARSAAAISAVLS